MTDNVTPIEELKDGTHEFVPVTCGPMYAPSEQARKALFDDLLQIQTKIENPKHDLNNPHYNSTYLSLESLLTYLRPLLVQHNFVMLQAFDGGRITTTLMHAKGGYVYAHSEIPTGVSAQQMVSFSTYMRRTHLTALLGIRGEDDDDGNMASTGGLRQKAAETQAPWMQQQAPAPAPAPMPAPAPAPVQQQIPAPPVQQPMAPPQAVPAPPPAPPAAPPAPVAAQQPPEDAIVGNELQEAQNILTAIHQIWGPAQVAGIMEKIGLPDISHMRHVDYASFVEAAMGFCHSAGKTMNLLGPDSGNQVLIQ